MGKFHIRIVGGWCGNRMVMVQENLSVLLAEMGYEIKIDHQSIWENYAPPQHADLVLQLIPAFSPEELGRPSISIRPFLKDLNHQDTINEIFQVVEEHCPGNTEKPVGSYPIPVQAG
jgi:hypothetical protein